MNFIDLEKVKSAVGEGVEASKKIVAAHDTLFSLKNKIAELKVEAEPFENMLKEYMQEKEHLTHHGDLLATWKTGKTGKYFDVKKFSAKEPKLFKKFLKKKDPIRRFMLKGVKEDED